MTVYYCTYFLSYITKAVIFRELQTFLSARDKNRPKPDDKGGKKADEKHKTSSESSAKSDSLEAPFAGNLFTSCPCLSALSVNDQRAQADYPSVTSAGIIITIVVVIIY